MNRSLLLALLLALAWPAGLEAFAVGDRVEVVKTDALNVRTGPGTSYPKVGPPQDRGKQGVIVEGPKPSVPGGNPWPKINYDAGSDGWSSEAYLQAVAVTPPTPTPTPPTPGDQAPGTWKKILFAVRPVHQPILGGDQNIAEGQPGAAYSNCPRPIMSDAAGIFRSYSSTLAIGGGRLLLVGGGHAGHPGNDMPIIDFLGVVSSYPWPAECPAAYINGVANPVWRGITGGAVMTYGLSPAGRPLVQHMYINHAFDSKRNRYLVINGRGLMANPIGTGQWSILSGRDRTQNEIIWGSAGGLAYDDVRDSAVMFVSDSQNGAPDGIYEQRFDTAGAVREKRRVMEWPSTPGMCWRCANIIHPLYVKERREVILLVTPSSSSPSMPRNQMWRYHLDQETLTRDVTWIPGTPQYDQVWAVDQTRARLFARAPGETWLVLAGAKHLNKGAWIQDDSVTPFRWRWLSIPETPGLAWWTLFCDATTPYCGGFVARSTYAGGRSSGGLADLWLYRRP